MSLQPAFPKKTAATGRKRRRALYRKLRPETRAAAWAKDGGRCAWPRCRVALALQDAHAHEVTPRSLGGDPLDVDGILTLCAGCHADMHVRVGGKRKRIEGTRSTGLRFFARVDGVWEEDVWSG